jgi:hypothetical protein
MNLDLVKAGRDLGAVIRGRLVGLRKLPTVRADSVSPMYKH